MDFVHDKIGYGSLLNKCTITQIFLLSYLKIYICTYNLSVGNLVAGTDRNTYNTVVHRNFMVHGCWM